MGSRPDRARNDRNGEVRLLRAEPVGWEKYARLFETVRAFEGATPTRDLLIEAGLAQDPRGGIGGLHAASALRLCHAQTAGRRALIWLPGPRPSGEPVPKLAREENYLRVLAFLKKHPRMAYPSAFLMEVAQRHTRQELMGAMKLFVASGLVVHLAMRPWTKTYAISCWGWASPDIRDADRIYRGGWQIRRLSLDSDRHRLAIEIEQARQDT